MTYETVSSELFKRFPELHRQASDSYWYSEEEPLNYLIFGDILKPYLESSLERNDSKSIEAICEFLEDAAKSAAMDRTLGNLLAVEIGEWLEYTKYEAQVGPWLGSETKRICRYVPRLATQRLQIKAETRQRSVSSSIVSIWKRFSR